MAEDPEPLWSPTKSRRGRRGAIVAIAIAALLGVVAVGFVAFSGLGPCPAMWTSPIQLQAGNWTEAGSIRVDAYALPAGGSCRPFADHMAGVDLTRSFFLIWGANASGGPGEELFRGGAGVQETAGGGRITVMVVDNAPRGEFSAGDVIVVGAEGAAAARVRGGLLQINLHQSGIVLANLPA